MNNNRKKVRLFSSVLSAVTALALLLGGALRPDIKLTAEECYRMNADSLLYLRSYYESGSLKATGSGFVASEDGTVITAAHVVKGGDRLAAVREDGSELELTLVQSDEETDIAVLRLPEGEYKPVTLADKAPNAGAVVRAMGYPIKDTSIITEGLIAATCGDVSGKSRMLVTCSIVNGMSGGPIMDTYGRVVGVVSGSVRTMDGIHLSVLSEALIKTAGEVGLLPTERTTEG